MGEYSLKKKARFLKQDNVFLVMDHETKDGKDPKYKGLNVVYGVKPRSRATKSCGTAELKNDCEARSVAI